MSNTNAHTQNPVYGRSIFEVVAELGLDPQPRGEWLSIYCPSCDAGGRPRSKGRNAWASVESNTWGCRSCQERGTAASLSARAGLTDASIPRRTYVAPVPTGDIGALWTAAGHHQPENARRVLYGWASTVRGWPLEMAATASEWADLRVVSDELGRVERTIGRSLANDRSRPIIAALRDPSGAVQSLVRCWAGEGEQPEHKRVTLSSKYVGSLDTPTYGSVPEAVEAARQGRPVFVTEGLPDTVAAWALTRPVYGAVVGSYTAQGAPGVGAALAGQLAEAGVDGATVYLLVQQDRETKAGRASWLWRDALVEALASSQAVQIVDLAELRGDAKGETFDVADYVAAGGELAGLLDMARVADRVVERVEAAEAVEAAGLPSYLLPGRAAEVFDGFESCRIALTAERSASDDEPAEEEGEEEEGEEGEEEEKRPAGPHGKDEPRPWTPKTMRVSREMRALFGRVIADVSGGRYLRADTADRVADARVVVMRSPTGRGKTEVIARLRELFDARCKAADVDAHAHAWTHRRTLTDELQRRLGLDATHTNASGEVVITPQTVTSIALCVDSMSKAAREFAKVDRTNARFQVIIDEAESVFAHLATCARDPFERGAVFSSMRDLLRTADQIIIADATLSDFSLRQLARMLGVEPAVMLGQAVFVDDRCKRASINPIEIVWLDHPEDAKIALLEMVKAGVTPLYHCGSIKKAKALHSLVGELVGADDHYPRVTGDHDDVDGRDLMKAPTQWVTDRQGRIRAIIATTALESGVSIDSTLTAGLADTVIVDAEDHMTVQQIIQAASRARHAARWYVHAPAHGRVKYTKEADLRRALLEGKEDTARAMTKAPRVKWLEPKGAKPDRLISDSEWFDSYVEARVHVDRSRAFTARDLWSYLTSEGYTITHPTTLPHDEDRARMAEMVGDRRDVIRKVEVAAIVDADDSEMTPAEAAKVMERTDRIEDRPAAAKCLIREFYGTDGQEAVELDRDGGREMVRRWVDLAALLSGRVGDVQRRDRRELELVGTDNRLRRSCVTWAVLEAFGVTPAMILGTACGERVKVTINRVDHDFEGVVINPTSVDRHRIWQWLARREIRDAVKQTIGCDPWAQIPRKERRATIDALIAWNDGASEGGTGLDLDNKNADPSRVPAMPERTNLAMVYSAALRRLGLVSRSVRVRVDGGRVRVQAFDLDTARRIRRLAGRQFAKVTGQHLPPVEIETSAEMSARHAEELEAHRAELESAAPDELAARHLGEVEQMEEAQAMGKADESDVEAMAARHLVELVEALPDDEVVTRHRVERAIQADPLLRRGAGAPVQPSSHQIAQLVSTYALVRLRRGLWAHWLCERASALSVDRLVSRQTLSGRGCAAGVDGRRAAGAATGARHPADGRRRARPRSRRRRRVGSVAGARRSRRRGR